jgi:hypothetical protein
MAPTGPVVPYILADGGGGGGVCAGKLIDRTIVMNIKTKFFFI